MSSAGFSAGVAVIVPVFNRLELLKCTVASLQAQTLATAQFILVDDRSDKPVWRYLQSLPAQDARFSVMRKPDSVPQGCQTSRNLALEMCRAEAVMFLDSDDLLDHRCLEERYSVLAANPESDLVVGCQAMFKEGAESLRWVNVPRTGVLDLDRFLDLANPLDVPWVNGGVMIRTASLHSEGIAWRPEFHWDDVAFHFECLVSELRVMWMTASGCADAYYRMHSGERYGTKLFTPEGIRNTAGMLHWMRQKLEEAGKCMECRRRALAMSFFHTCVLRSIDAGENRLASELMTGAMEAGLLQPGELRRMHAYRIGRQCCRRSVRATYYWNRLTDRVLLRDFFHRQPWTYGNVVVAAPEAAVALEELLRKTAAPPHMTARSAVE